MVKNKWKMSWALVSISCFFACNDVDVDCQIENDCMAGAHCDTEIGECVECFSNLHCDEGKSFCCAGRCEAIESVFELCGCDPRKQGNPGTDCGLNFSLGETELGGPLCHLDGNMDFEAPDISKANCGCVDQGDGDEPCGRDANQLIGFCVDHQCEAQSDGACGSDKELCSTANLGPRCLAKGDGYGVCGCQITDESGAAGRCDERVDGHQIADSCDPDKARCLCRAAVLDGPLTVCDPDSSTPDCTSDGCTNILTDPAHCGASDNACDPGKKCFAGACECTTHDVCATEITNLCAHAGDEKGFRCVCGANIGEDDFAKACDIGMKCDRRLGCVLPETAK